MPTIQVSEFEAKCLSWVEDAARSGEVLVITKNGKPVAELHPSTGGRTSSPIGQHIQIVGDIVSPLEKNAWEAVG